MWKLVLYGVVGYVAFLYVRGSLLGASAALHHTYWWMSP